MKKFAILILCMVCVSFVMADDLAKLQEAHKAAMQFHGRTVERGQFVYMSGSNGMISACLGKEVSTFYGEREDKKFYVEWKLIPGGIEITFHINILGKEIVKTVTIMFGKDQVTIKGMGSDDRYDWMCLLKCVGGKIFECISCGTDWTCWATCAGADVVNCVMGCF